jgi:hypothetical protein
MSKFQKASTRHLSRVIILQLTSSIYQVFILYLVSLMDLGFSSHAFHSSSRLVFLEATLSDDHKTLEVTSPPNNRVYPPGPGRSFIQYIGMILMCYLAWLYVTVDDVTSPGAQVMVGSGGTPPLLDEGVPIPVRK